MNKFGFFRNSPLQSKPVTGDAPVINVTPVLANVNTGNVINFNITTNLTTQPTFFWSITGNVDVADFTDSEGLTGSVQLDSGGNATITKNLEQVGNANIDFAMNIRTGSAITPIQVTSNTVNTVSVTTMSASGGDSTVTVNEFFKAHRYNTSSTFNVTDLGDANFTSVLSNVTFVAVGGGGGGGYAALRGAGTATAVGRSAGGGGAGGQVVNSSNITSVSNHTVTIGTGGTGGVSESAIATQGSNTTVFGSTATGGGFGGSVDATTDGNTIQDASKLDGGAGVNGGGGAVLVDITRGNVFVGNAGVGTSFNGQIGITSTESGNIFLHGAGGGAGAGQEGQLPQKTTYTIGGIDPTPEFSVAKGGNGGTGFITDILGANITLAFGGGGGGGTVFDSGPDHLSAGGFEQGYSGNNPHGAGQDPIIGGVGAGERNPGGNSGGIKPFVNVPQCNVEGTAGLDGTGSGGGGGANFQDSANQPSATADGNDGGNGTVIVRYISSFRKATI